MQNEDARSKVPIEKSTAMKILAQVPYANGFHFFTSIGQYTGETAVSMEHFAGEIAFVPIETVEFHFKRGDFQKWFATTLGDDDLAAEIDRIDLGLSGEPLRKRILSVINSRIENLKVSIL